MVFDRFGVDQQQALLFVLIIWLSLIDLTNKKQDTTHDE